MFWYSINAIYFFIAYFLVAALSLIFGVKMSLSFLYFLAILMLPFLVLIAQTGSLLFVFTYSVFSRGVFSPVFFAVPSELQSVLMKVADSLQKILYHLQMCSIQISVQFCCSHPSVSSFGNFNWLIYFHHSLINFGKTQFTKFGKSSSPCLKSVLISNGSHSYPKNITWNWVFVSV